MRFVIAVSFADCMGQGTIINSVMAKTGQRYQMVGQGLYQFI